MYGSGLPSCNLLPVVERSSRNRNRYEITVASKMISDTMARWIFIGTWSVIRSVDSNTPIIPPELQSPWKEPLIFLSAVFWSVRACVFMEIFNTRILKAYKQSGTTSVRVLTAKPTTQMATTWIRIAKSMGTRLSNRETNHPESGKPISEPSGITSRMVPSSASL